MKRWLHNFLIGAGSLLEIMPPPREDSFPVTRKILSRSSADAFYEDWKKIGFDLRSAMSQAELDLVGKQANPSSSESHDGSASH